MPLPVGNRRAKNPRQQGILKVLLKKFSSSSCPFGPQHGIHQIFVPGMVNIRNYFRWLAKIVAGLLATDFYSYEAHSAFYGEKVMIGVFQADMVEEIVEFMWQNPDYRYTVTIY